MLCSWLHLILPLAQLKAVNALLSMPKPPPSSSSPSAPAAAEGRGQPFAGSLRGQLLDQLWCSSGVRGTGRM